MQISSARLRLAPCAPRSTLPSVLLRPARSTIRAAAGAEGAGDNPRQAELQGSDAGDNGSVEGEQHARATAVNAATHRVVGFQPARYLSLAATAC